MTGRYLVLVVAAVAVFGLGIYLFFEVRSAPAAVSVAPVHREPPVQARGEAPSHAEAAHTPAAPATPPDPTRPPPVQLGATEVSPPQLGGDERANPKLDAEMDEANKAYDTQDFDQAKMIASKILAQQPKNVRMLRIMVSSLCIDGDNTAQRYYDQLPKFDRDQMRTRCERYGVTFREPAQ